MKNFIFVFLFLGSASAQAYTMGIMGGMNMSSQSATVGPGLNGSTVSSTSGTGYQGGVYFAQNFTPMLTFELGLNYQSLQSKSTLTVLTGSTTITTTEKRLQVPLIVRYWFIPSILGFGVGGYYSMGLGNVKADSSNEAITASSNGSYKDAGLKSSDYGAVGSVQLRFPIGPTLRFLVDGRYLMGLAEQSTDTNNLSLKNREIDVLAGIGWGW